MLDLALEKGCRFAVLKENSPSCGLRLQFTDGTFTGRKIPGMGIAAGLLTNHGITWWEKPVWKSCRMGPFPAVNRNRSKGQEHFSESSEQDRSPEAAAGPRGGEESEAAGFFQGKAGQGINRCCWQLG